MSESFRTPCILGAAITNPKVEVKAVSDPFMDLKLMVYRGKYDTVHNGLHGTTATEEADGAEFQKLVRPLFRDQPIRGIDWLVFRDQSTRGLVGRQELVGRSKFD